MVDLSWYEWAKPLQQVHVEGAKVFASREEMLKSLTSVKGGRFAEIGVAFGDLSELFFKDMQAASLHAFDIFKMHEAELLWGKPSAEALNGKTHRGFYETRFDSEVKSGRLKVFEGDGADELAKQPDASYDLIYIDGDHTLPFVRRDATSAVQKLKPDGILVFDDYTLFDLLNQTYYGPVQVANDLCVTYGWHVVALSLHPAMYMNVALKRRRSTAARIRNRVKRVLGSPKSP